MAEKDTVTKEYMSDKATFADIFNYYVFDGKDTVKASALQKLDPAELNVILKDSGHEVAQKIRDLLKLCVMKEDTHTTYLLLGLENQSDIHYAMVVCNMISDALNY